MAGQQIIKYTVEHYRKEGISEEAFEKWIKEYHIPRSVPLMKKHGIIKYAVVSQPVVYLSARDVSWELS